MTAPAADTACPPGESVESLRKTSILHFRAADYAAARAIEDCLLELAQARGDGKEQAQSLNNLGVLAKRLGDADTAQGYYEQALVLRRTLGDQTGEAESLNNIAVLHKNRGEFYPALDLQLRALSLRRQLGNPIQTAQSLDNIALIYKALDDLAEAERYSREALATLGDAAAPLEQSRIRGNLGSILVDRGELTEAEAIAQVALDLAVEHKGRSAEIDSRHVLARVARLQGRAADALDQIETALPLAITTGDPKTIGEIEIERAGVLRELGRLAEARNQIEATLAAARARQARLIERAALDELARCAAALGDHEAAYSAREAHAKLDRELTGALTGRQMADLRGRLQARESEAEMALLQRDNEIQRLQIARQRILGIVLVVGALALGLLALLVAARLRYSRRANALLESKSRELEQAARTDPLTGLPNRLHIGELLAVPATGRRCLMLLDLDHFKAINDRHGHEAGDRALCAAADALRSAAGERATVGRWGGEEFVVVADEVIEGSEAALAESLLAALRAIELHHDGRPITLRASLGHACPRPGEAADQVLRRADAALYAAKQQGRDRVCGG
ncbi:MAG: diguanylate cyclase [Lysobacterales bacterium]